MSYDKLPWLKKGAGFLMREFSTMALVISVICLSAICANPVAAQEAPKTDNPSANSTNLQNSQALANQTAEVKDYIVGPGDLIDVRVFRQAELSGRYRVSELGTINLPFIGQLQAAGATEDKLTETIRTGLLKILRNPQVSVTVTEFNSQVVTVLGAVKTPGRYVMRRNERLLDVIGMAGGLSDVAGQTVNLVHYPSNNNTAKPSPTTGSANPTTPTTGEENKDDGIKVEAISLKELLNGNYDLNRPILSGDVISVPDADTIYVTGNVNKPGAYNPKVPITLSQAIALAGGMTAVARKSQISLFHTVSGKTDREEVVYNLGDIEKRKVKDPLLSPNDVIYIRGSESRSIGLAFIHALTNGLGGGVGLSVIR